MLTKINHIKNIGRFYEVVPKGTPASNCNFEIFNLIHADNATGKTTLATIIKSLILNEPERILTKKTIGSNGNCEVSLQFDGQAFNFLNDAWNNTPTSKIATFDEEFIEKNVFSSLGVDSTHKRQLFNYVVLGEENVDKANEMKKLVEETIPAITKEVGQLESQLKQVTGIDNLKDLLAMQELSPEDFEKLKSDVSEKETQIKNSESIKTHKTLYKIPSISLPDYTEVLSKGLDEIGNIEAFKEQINNHQKWIQDGLAIQDDSANCPYCFQDISDNKAINAYKQFFSSQCQDLLNKLCCLSKEINTNFSSDKALLVEKMVSANKDCFDFWQIMNKSISEIITFPQEYLKRIIKYHDTLLQIISDKQNNIFQPIQITEQDAIILKIADELFAEINDYNTSVDSFNMKIAVIKEQHNDINKLIHNHDRNSALLKAQSAIFYDEKTMQSLSRYRSLVVEKQKLTDKLGTLRAEINSASATLLKNYQKSINQLLKSFGVEYRIHKVEQKADTARKETLVFTIELKGFTFEPNGSRDEPYSLANTLSSGDKSTLAFALFMAKLEHTDIKDMIIIFDDPISSLDFFRKLQTSKKISEISTKSKQVIILTHSMEFTKLFKYLPVKSKYFKLIKADSMAGVVFIPYDKLSEMCVSKHYDEHEMLLTFLSSPSSVKRLDVMKSIRSYVETKLCAYRPELHSITPATLGRFIEYLRKEKVPQFYIDNLEIINDSIVIENHGGDPIADDHTNLTDDELRNLCKLALDLSAPPTE